MRRFQPVRQVMPHPTPFTKWNSFQMQMLSIVYFFSIPNSEIGATTHCKVHVIPIIFAMLLEFTIVAYCVLTVQPWCFVCIFGTFTQICKLWSASGSWLRIDTTPVQPMNGSWEETSAPGCPPHFLLVSPSSSTWKACNQGCECPF